MSGHRRVVTVKLNEKALWRLHDKLKRIEAKEKEVEKNEEPEPAVRTRQERKPAKFQVYQPGVTRLSSRKLAANFDKSSSEKPATKVTPPSKDKASIPSGNDNYRRSGYTTSRDRGRSQNQSKQRQDEPEEEGFLARYRRRVRRGETKDDFSEDDDHRVQHDDELAWDNYGGSGLVHEGWSPQVTSGDVSSKEDEFSDREIYPELNFDEGPAEVNLEEQVKDGEVTEEEERSITTSESNKEYYRVAHSISSPSEDELDSEEEYGQEASDEEENTERKPQLYDPSNPEQPIPVNPTTPTSTVRGQGRFINPADNYTNNVYNPRANHSRVTPLSKRVHRNRSSPSKQYQRLSPSCYDRRQSSPPRYHGNHYPDDSYDSNSPAMRRYHYSENLSEDEDTVTAQSTTMRHQLRIAILNEAERYESTLSNLLASPSFDAEEYNETLGRVRNKVKMLYEKLIINDIEAATNENIDQKLWRNVYYQVIEILREQIRSCPEQDSTDLRDNLLLLLDQGTAFYEGLLENFQRRYRFNLKDILNSASARKRHRLKSGKRSKLAILSCQRVFISLGDIARYREQASHSDNYGRAKHCYLQAQLLAPKNGRPYNQLAILAVKTRHKLDAVYYYVRSLVVSNPILSARESLMALFDEVRRKLDYVSHKQGNNASEKSSKVTPSSNDSRSSSRLNDLDTRRWEEVWILPGTEEKPQIWKDQQQDPVEEIPELKLTESEIAKHFILLFLNLHGKLFTRIGLETFSKILTKCLKLYEVTIRNINFITSFRLLQFTTINLFAVLNADKSIHDSAHDSTQNQRRALRLTFSMFAVTVEYLNKMFRDESMDPFMSEDLAVFMPSVKIMFDWMYANKNIWYPPPKDLTESWLNVWDSLAELCNWVFNDDRFKPMVQVYDETGDGLHEMFLPEDTQLAGFSPLGLAFSDPRFVENAMISVQNKVLLQQTVRICLIRDFLEYLCGMEEPLLAFKQGVYVSVALTRTNSWGDSAGQHNPEMPLENEFEDYSTNEQFYPSESNEFQHESGELGELRKLRDSLQMKKDLKNRRETQMKTSLESEERIKLEICPKFLVPDTNCFIDHQDLIEKLMKSGKFKIATPLVVISELEGLSTDKKSETAHAEHVYQSATKAIKFIENCVSSNNMRFCVLTKKGTELKTLRFRSEETQTFGSNDDFILQSAHGYTEYHAPKREESIVNGEKILRRYVVLLTDDRNLRLKAHMQDTATRGISNFCSWVKL